MRRTGDGGSEVLHHRHEARDDDGLGAVAFEVLLACLDRLDLDAEAGTDALDQVTAPAPADEVADVGADERSERRQREDHEGVEPVPLLRWRP